MDSKTSQTRGAGFSLQGRDEDHWEATAAKEIRDLGIPTAVGGKEGSGNGGDTDIHHTEAEYGRGIYCDATDYGPMRAGHPVSWRWWEQSEIDLERAQKWVAASSTTISETEPEEESDREPYGISGGGEEESLGASGSSGAEWSGVERSGARRRTIEHAPIPKKG